MKALYRSDVDGDTSSGAAAAAETNVINVMAATAKGRPTEPPRSAQPAADTGDAQQWFAAARAYKFVPGRTPRVPRMSHRSAAAGVSRGRRSEIACCAWIVSIQ